MIRASHSDLRFVRFPSSFGRGPDNALMPTVLDIFKGKMLDLSKYSTIEQFQVEIAT
jgi:hypothetical protein